MSLEDALNANTKAVLAHNSLLEKMLAGGSAPAKPAAAAASKPAAAAAATKPATPAKAAPKTTTDKRKGEITAEHVAERVTTFLKTGDKETRDERKLQAKTIIDHYGADRFTNIDAAHFEEALGFLSAYEAGEEPDFGDASGEDDGGDDESMV